MSLSDSGNSRLLWNGRVLYFDYLRVLGIYTTVAIHIITQVWNGADIHGFSWKVYNVFLSFYCWGVPVFTMISGALFLNPGKPVQIKALYSKSIVRLLIGFCFWSVAYGILFDIRGYTVEHFLYSLFTGDFHMWFVFMICVMYMLTPLLRKFTCDKVLTEYFLKLSLLMSFLIPQALFLLDLLEIPFLDSMIQGLSKSFSDISGYFPNYYLFYFVAGYYLSVTDLTKKTRTAIYLAGMAGYLFTVIATDRYSCFLGVESQVFHAKNGVNIAAMAIAVFTFGKYHLANLRFSDQVKSRIVKLSGCCLGIYYVHLMIIKSVYGIFDLSLKNIHPFITCLVFPPIAFVLSYLTTALMRSIPFLKKFV